MNSFYGGECAKHPELAGRRYALNNNCIKCHNERGRLLHVRRKQLLAELIEAALEVTDYPRLTAALEAMGHVKRHS